MNTNDGSVDDSVDGKDSPFAVDHLSPLEYIASLPASGETLSIHPCLCGLQDRPWSSISMESRYVGLKLRMGISVMVRRMGKAKGDLKYSSVETGQEG
jgi:hypothetical protein